MSKPKRIKNNQDPSPTWDKWLPAIVVAIITFIGSITVAIINRSTTMTTVLMPIEFTQTAEARSTSFASVAGTQLSITDTVQSALPTINSTPLRLPNFAKLGDTWTRPTDGAVMVYVPGGTFAMGSTASEIDKAGVECKQLYGTCEEGIYQDETPQHSVTLSGFWLDQTEVTHNQYMLCVANGMCEVPNYASISPFNLDNHPVVGVSWQGAVDYCAWAGAVLPTESQWEYAARGQEGFIYSWGNEFNGDLLNYCDINCSEDHHANDFDDGFPETAPVDIFRGGASWNGALNLNGNVWEWVYDWYEPYNASSLIDPVGPSNGTYKVVRGGSWINDKVGIRSANRSFPAPDERSNFVGFRCSVAANDPIPTATATSAPFSAEIRITEPHDHGEVAAETTIKGISRNIPVGSEIWIALYFPATSRYYLFLNNPAVVDLNGAWSVPVLISQGDESRLMVDIIVILADDTVQNAFLLYPNNQVLEINALPPSVTVFDRISVITK